MAELRLVEWVEQAVVEARASTYGFHSNHLDEIGLQPSRLPSLEQAADLATSARGIVDSLGAGGRVDLAVPLGASSVLDVRLPDLEAWPVDELEPPLLYYFEPRHWASLSDREEYRCPYPTERLSRVLVAVVYACGRSVVDRSSGWEYSRTLWISAIEEGLGQGFAPTR